MCTARLVIEQFHSLGHDYVGNFGLPGSAISLEALGEPKSGTTWLGRLVPSLALELCGSFNNLW